MRDAANLLEEIKNWLAQIRQAYTTLSCRQQIFFCWCLCVAGMRQSFDVRHLLDELANGPNCRAGADRASRKPPSQVTRLDDGR